MAIAGLCLVLISILCMVGFFLIAKLWSKLMAYFGYGKDDE